MHDPRPFRAILASKEEDRFTAFLAELLRLKSFQTAFLKELCGLEGFDDAIPMIRTHLSVPGGVTDLTIEGPKIFLIVEAKLASWLHQGQLIPYAKKLVEWSAATIGGKAKLLLLAPAASLAVAVDEAQEQLSAASLTVDFTPIAWEATSTLAKAIATSQSGRGQTYLEDYSQLIDERLGQEIGPLAPDELALLRDPLAARALVRTLDLASRTARLITGAASSPNIAAGRFYCGHNIAVDGRKHWMGVWLDAWEELSKRGASGITPLMLQAFGERVAEYIRNPPPDLPRAYPHFNGTWTSMLVPLPVGVGVAPDVQAARLASIIEGTLNHLERLSPRKVGSDPQGGSTF